MGFLDNIGKSLTQGIDRAKFEAERIARIARIQGEVSELNRQMDAKRLELADRAYELYKAGQIQSATIASIAKEIEKMRVRVTLKEDELKAAQTDTYVEPAPTPTSPPQTVQVSVEPSAPTSTPPPQTVVPQPSVPTDKKTCPNCGFVMPSTALFCPSCGTRVGA